MINASSLQNKQLINLCKLYGSNARLWLRKFANLLPEVYRRGLYKKANCRSIHEFAAKYSGMNRDTADQILLLDRNLEDKPILRSLLEEHGWSKLRVVANIATKETDKVWAEKVKKLTKGTLEIYVQEWRKRQETAETKTATSRENTGNVSPNDALAVTREGTVTNTSLSNATIILDPRNNNLFSACQPAHQQLTGFPGETCCNENNRSGERSAELTEPGNDQPQSWTSINIKLDPETEFKLRLLKQKLEKQKREPITFNQVIKYMLGEIEKGNTDAKSEKHFTKEIEPKGAEKAENLPENQVGNAAILDTAISAAVPMAASRYIPAKIRNQITDRFQHHCVFPGCNRPADEFHHVKKFALYHQHDPDYIVSLCKIHHKFAHSGLIKNEMEEPERWEVKI